MKAGKAAFKLLRENAVSGEFLSEGCHDVSGETLADAALAQFEQNAGADAAAAGHHFASACQGITLIIEVIVFSATRDSVIDRSGSKAVKPEFVPEFFLTMIAAAENSPTTGERFRIVRF